MGFFDAIFCGFCYRAKTIKNTVVVNEELTADEWRRRYEKERDKAARLKLLLTKLEFELNRWRNGEKVNPQEQINLRDLASLVTSATAASAEALTPILAADLLPTPTVEEPSSGLLPAAGPRAAAPAGGAAAPSLTNDERQLFEKEKDRLFSQLDEKVQ